MNCERGTKGTPTTLPNKTHHKKIITLRYPSISYKICQDLIKTIELSILVLSSDDAN